MDAYKNLSLSGKVYLVLALPLVSVALMLFYIASELKAPMGIPMMIALAGCLPGFLLAANLSGYLNSMLEDAAQMVDAIAKGNSTSRFRMSSQDALGRLAYTLQNLQTSVTRMMKSDEGSDSGAAQDAQTTALIKALDVCDTSMMLADADLNIIYMNEAVIRMMSGREKQIQTQLSNFDSRSLIGTCVDDFHQNPSHQRGMLKGLREAYKTDLPLAGLTFGLIATPLYSDSGERLGTVVEWDDKTERLAKEAEEDKISADNLRIKQSLDVCDTSVMVADADLNIIYMNKAVGEMMGDRETQIRTQLSNFDSKSLIGTCVDDFHKNPS
ncbi:MAG: PAS domain-containing protein, partial [Pseudomonadales bacterium]|nr:PAS domain-containing protein [Pseudomonadales bacterium]